MKGEPFRPFKILYATSDAIARPTFAVDITKQYEGRRRAILAYKSQFTPPKKSPKSKVYFLWMSSKAAWAIKRATTDA